MKNKPRIQPALRSLSDSDRELLANWLRTDHYDTVLERVRKPRSEGGLGLAGISKSPLQTFYAKVALLDLINSRVPEDKKMTISQFESLANGDLLVASSRLGPNPTPTLNPNLPTESSSDQPLPLVSRDVHDAILETTYDLVTSGENTPTQLLALQRLADFPARAEYREHKRQLELRKDQRDLEMAAHKRSMDEHRQHITNERLKLSERAFALREKELEWKQSRKGSAAVSAAVDGVPPDTFIPSDHLGYLAANLDDIEARATKHFNLPPVAAPRESAANIDANDAPNPATVPSELENPPPVAAFCESAANSTKSQPETEITSTPVEEDEPAAQNPSASAKSESSAVKNSSSPISIDSCPFAVKAHAVKRWRSFIPEDKTTTQPDESWRDECACGKPLPCPDHPELWLRIRYYRPQNISYKEALEDAGIPYYVPTPEELGCSEETLTQSMNPFTNNPQIKDAPSPYAIPCSKH